MTLVLTLGNPDQVIQIADRRVSWNGCIVDDETNKGGVIFCLNGRLAFGFKGLARYGSFATREWLLDTLSDAAPPDFTIGEILEKVKNAAMKTFAEHPSLKAAPKEHKRLSILFSGYLYLDDPPLQGFAIITNFQDFQTGRDDSQAWEEFSVSYWTERRPSENIPTLIQRVGNWQAMNGTDETILRGLLEARKPHKAIIGKATELIREMADRSVAQGTIGKQLSTVRIPRNPQEQVETGYYSAVNLHTTYLPDLVCLLPTQHYVIKDAKVEAVDPLTTPPISVPKVGRKKPCPCGSGKKYKYCHGRTL